MKFPSRTASGIICVCLVLAGHNCAGQTSPPPAGHSSPAAPPDAETVPLTPPSEKPAAPAPTPPAPAPAKEPAAASSTAPASVPRHAADSGSDTASAKRYIIGPLDEIEVKVWNDQRLGGFFPVGPDGTITMQLLGDIKADGLTEKQLAEVIRTKLAESVFAKTPDLNEVTVKVVRINSKKVFVYGGVSRGGEFPLNGETTVMDILAMCLPFKEFTNPKGIYVLRGGKKLPFNYTDFIKGKKGVQDIPLQNGDRIIVPEGH